MSLVFAERECRVCGCTDDRACFDEGPCFWVEVDLCSACVSAAREPMVAGRSPFIAVGALVGILVFGAVAFGLGLAWGL